MIWRGLRGFHTIEHVKNPSFSVVVVTGFFTSIDNIAAGFALPFLSVDVPITLGAVGLVTLIMTLIGLG